MTNSRSTKRALIASAISVLLCVSMLLGTTYAWFTDSVTSANNIIVSGNLDVELYYQVEGQTDWTEVTDQTNIFMQDALWEPGHTEVVKLKVVNAGTLALKYQLGVNVASETGSTNVLGDAFKLSDYIMYGVVEGAQTYTRDEAVAAVSSTAKALNVGYTKASSLVPGATTEEIVTMVVYMPTSVGNEANYAKGAAVPKIELGINLYATQVEYEGDSFGTDYDKNAGFDTGKTNVGPQGLDVLSNGIATYDGDTKTYTIDVSTVGQGGWNASQGAYYAGYTVNVAGYGENATVKFNKADGTEVTWKLADEERDGFIRNGEHQQWTTVGLDSEYRYDIDGDDVTDFAVVNKVADAKVEVSNAEQLKKVLEQEAVSAILTADITVDVDSARFITIPVGVDVTLDMGDHNIIATSNSSESVELFYVEGTFDVVGYGTMSLTNDNYGWNSSYRYTTINIRENAVVTLGNGVNVVCEAGDANGNGMAYAVDIYHTGTLNINGASLHSNYIAVRCFYGNSVVNVNSGSITSSKNNWGIWPQSAPGAVITVANGITYTTDTYGIYIFG